MKRALAFLVLTAAFVAATAVGWWTIPLTGLLWGALGPAFRRPALVAGLAAALAWALWLAYDARHGGVAFMPFVGRVAGVLTIPVPVLLLATLLFVGLLAWSAAALAGTLRPSSPT